MFPITSSTLWSPEPALCQGVRATLDLADVTEVSSVFLLPARSRTRTRHGRTYEVRLRYPVQVQLVPDGEPAYLRSHGTDFHIIPIEWLATGPRRVYSLGPGLRVEGDEVLVLLVQSIGDAWSDKSLVNSLKRMNADVVTSDAPEYGLPCLRISAAFLDVRYPLSTQRTAASA